MIAPLFAISFATDGRMVLLQIDRRIELENGRAEKLPFHLKFEIDLFVIEAQLGCILEYIRRGSPSERLLDVFAPSIFYNL